MLEEIYPGIYRTILSDSTKEQGVSKINIFILPGETGKRSLMIDTGFQQPFCLEQLLTDLAVLSISLPELDVFLTHRHHDHSGLAGALAERGAQIFMNAEEERHPYDCLTYKPTKETEEEQIRVLRRAGVTRELTPNTYQSFIGVAEREHSRGEKWILEIDSFPYRDLQEGDVFAYGQYCLRAIPLKGHTFGQMGLLDTEHKLLFSADQLISGVSPIVATTYPDEGLLQAFFDSLAYIKSRCTEGWLVLPAHGKLISGGEEVRDCVDKSVFSYLSKSSQVKSILEESASFMTARDVMKKLYRVAHAPEDEGQLFTYKMTLTKTFSLLEYLRDIGFVSREDREGTYYWRWKKAAD